MSPIQYDSGVEEEAVLVRLDKELLIPAVCTKDGCDTAFGVPFKAKKKRRYPCPDCGTGHLVGYCDTCHEASVFADALSSGQCAKCSKSIDLTPPGFFTSKGKAVKLGTWAAEEERPEPPTKEEQSSTEEEEEDTSEPSAGCGAEEPKDEPAEEPVEPDPCYVNSFLLQESHGPAPDEDDDEEEEEDDDDEDEKSAAKDFYEKLKGQFDLIENAEGALLDLKSKKAGLLNLFSEGKSLVVKGKDCFAEVQKWLTDEWEEHEDATVVEGRGDKGTFRVFRTADVEDSAKDETVLDYARYEEAKKPETPESIESFIPTLNVTAGRTADSKRSRAEDVTFIQIFAGDAADDEHDPYCKEEHEGPQNFKSALKARAATKVVQAGKSLESARLISNTTTSSSAKALRKIQKAWSWIKKKAGSDSAKEAAKQVKVTQKDVDKAREDLVKEMTDFEENLEQFKTFVDGPLDKHKRKHPIITVSGPHAHGSNFEEERGKKILLPLPDARAVIGSEDAALTSSDSRKHDVVYDFQVYQKRRPWHTTTEGWRSKIDILADLRNNLDLVLSAICSPRLGEKDLVTYEIGVEGCAAPEQSDDPAVVAIPSTDPVRALVRVYPSDHYKLSIRNGDVPTIGLGAEGTLLDKEGKDKSVEEEDEDERTDYVHDFDEFWDWGKEIEEEPKTQAGKAAKKGNAYVETFQEIYAHHKAEGKEADEYFTNKKKLIEKLAALGKSEGDEEEADSLMDDFGKKFVGWAGAPSAISEYGTDTDSTKTEEGEKSNKESKDEEENEGWGLPGGFKVLLVRNDEQPNKAIDLPDLPEKWPDVDASLDLNVDVDVDLDFQNCWTWLTGQIPDLPPWPDLEWRWPEAQLRWPEFTFPGFPTLPDFPTFRAHWLDIRRLSLPSLSLPFDMSDLKLPELPNLSSLSFDPWSLPSLPSFPDPELVSISELAQSLVKILTNLGQVWENLEKLIPTFGWHFSFDIDCLKGGMDWEWQWREQAKPAEGEYRGPQDTGVYFWQKGQVEMMPFKFMLSLQFGLKMGVEAIVHVTLRGHIALAAKWETQWDKQNEQWRVMLEGQATQNEQRADGTVLEVNDASGLQAEGQTIGEFGVRVVLRKPDWAKAEAKLETGYGMLAKLVFDPHEQLAGESASAGASTPSARPRMEYELTFLGLRMEATICIKVFNIKSEKEHWLIPESDLPCAYGVLPGGQAGKWHASYQQLVMAGRDLAVARAALRKILAEYEDLKRWIASETSEDPLIVKRHMLGLHKAKDDGYEKYAFDFELGKVESKVFTDKDELQKAYWDKQWQHCQDIWNSDLTYTPFGSGQGEKYNKIKLSDAVGEAKGWVRGLLKFTDKTLAASLNKWAGNSVGKHDEVGCAFVVKPTEAHLEQVKKKLTALEEYGKQFRAMEQAAARTPEAQPPETVINAAKAHAEESRKLRKDTESSVETLRGAMDKLQNRSGLRPYWTPPEKRLPIPEDDEKQESK